MGSSKIKVAGFVTLSPQDRDGVVCSYPMANAQIYQGRVMMVRPGEESAVV